MKSKTYLSNDGRTYRPRQPERHAMAATFAPQEQAALSRIDAIQAVQPSHMRAMTAKEIAEMRAR